MEWRLLERLVRSPLAAESQPDLADLVQLGLGPGAAQPLGGHDDMVPSRAGPLTLFETRHIVETPLSTAGGAMTSATSKPLLSDFFVGLANDPAQLDAYERDPRAALLAAGLRNAQIDAVLRGGPERVREALEAELAADPLRRRLVTTPRMTAHTPTEETNGGDESEEEPEEPDEPEPSESEPSDQ
jgi:hypothetical protein